jgi:hypothetical protein
MKKDKYKERKRGIFKIKIRKTNKERKNELNK